jgi:hypothetical protein
VAGVGVRLTEAPDTPSRGVVHIRIPSGHSCGSANCDSTRRWWVALGDIHPSGDAESLHAPNRSPRPRPRWFARTAVSRIPIHTELAKCITTGLIDQVGGDSGSPVAVKNKRRHRVGPVSGKDPL